jgi:hypothetical protein
MYIMDLNPQRFATGPISPDFTQKKETHMETTYLMNQNLEQVVHRVLGYGVYLISYKKHMICKFESNQYINIHVSR